MASGRRVEPATLPTLGVPAFLRWMAADLERSMRVCMGSEMISKAVMLVGSFPDSVCTGSRGVVLRPMPRCLAMASGPASSLLPCRIGGAPASIKALLWMAEGLRSVMISKAAILVGSFPVCELSDCPTPLRCGRDCCQLAILGCSLVAPSSASSGPSSSLPGAILLSLAFSLSPMRSLFKCMFT